MLRLSGTQINFRSPPHCSRVRPFRPLPTTYSLCDIHESKVEGSSDSSVGGYHPFIGCFEQEWSFRGLPVIQPNVGRLTLSMRVVQGDAYGTLFNPENLQRAYAETVRQTYGPAAGVEQAGGAGEQASCGYQIINDSRWFSADGPGREEGSQRRDWYIAITSIHFLIVSFEKKSTYRGGGFAKACDRLTDKIMGTFRIELSAEAKRQQLEAREQMPVEQFLASSSGLVRNEQAPDQYRHGAGEVFQDGAEYDAKIVPIKRRHV